MKIGLLLPENSGYPKLAQHYLTGFELMVLSQNQDKSLSEIQTEYYSIYNNEFFRKVKSMLFESDADIIVAHASISLINDVWELFHQNEKILVATILGEKVGTTIPFSPFVYINSLNLWQSNWALGKWSAENIGHKAAIVNTFYDAGYDSGNTFKLGFENGGGKQIGIFIIDPPRGTFNPGAVVTELEKFSPDVIFANLSGIGATAFLKAYLKSGLKGNAELVASPLALTEQAFTTIGSDCCGIKSVFTWSPVLENKMNVEFVTLLENEKKENADVFHLLGFETAMMILDAVKKSGMTSFNTQSFYSALENTEMVSPRGLVKMDKKSHIASSPYYMREVSFLNNNLVNLIISDQLDVTDENDEEIHREYSGITSGWINPYLTT
jgi:branched-chain amino acid transport system substrate-binding protein